MFSFKKKKKRTELPWEKNINTYEALLLAAEHNKVTHSVKERREAEAAEAAAAAEAAKKRRERHRQPPVLTTSSTIVEEVDPQSLTSADGALKRREEDAWSSSVPDMARMRDAMQQRKASLASDVSSSVTTTSSSSQHEIQERRRERLSVAPQEIIRAHSPIPTHEAPAPPTASSSGRALAVVSVEAAQGRRRRQPTPQPRHDHQPSPSAPATSADTHPQKLALRSQFPSADTYNGYSAPPTNFTSDSQRRWRATETDQHSRHLSTHGVNSTHGARRQLVASPTMYESQGAPANAYYAPEHSRVATSHADPFAPSPMHAHEQQQRLHHVSPPVSYNGRAESVAGSNVHGQPQSLEPRIQAPKSYSYEQAPVYSSPSSHSSRRENPYEMHSEPHFQQRHAFAPQDNVYSNPSSQGFPYNRISSQPFDAHNAHLAPPAFDPNAVDQQPTAPESQSNFAPLSESAQKVSVKSHSPPSHPLPTTHHMSLEDSLFALNAKAPPSSHGSSHLHAPRNVTSEVSEDEWTSSDSEAAEMCAPRPAPRKFTRATAGASAEQKTRSDASSQFSSTSGSSGVEQSAISTSYEQRVSNHSNEVAPQRASNDSYAQPAYTDQVFTRTPENNSYPEIASVSSVHSALPSSAQPYTPNPTAADPYIDSDSSSSSDSSGTLQPRAPHVDCTNSHRAYGRGFNDFRATSGGRSPIVDTTETANDVRQIFGVKLRSTTLDNISGTATWRWLIFRNRFFLHK